MKNLVLAIAFVLMGSLPFANAEEFSITEDTKIENSVIEKSFDYSLDYQIYFEDDICTITVTIRYSDGTSYSATASNNQEDCDAARSEAYRMARALAAFH